MYYNPGFPRTKYQPIERINAKIAAEISEVNKPPEVITDQDIIDSVYAKIQTACLTGKRVVGTRGVCRVQDVVKREFESAGYKVTIGPGLYDITIRW